MKPIEEQDHYEVLELPYNARLEDIRRAYPIVRAAYDHESLAVYSLFGSDESELIRERIDVAYRVLTDDDSRRRYDEQIGIDADRQAPGEPAIALDAAPSSGSAADVLSALDALDEMDEREDEENGDWDGAKLRRARMRRGIELDRISDITKINGTYLRSIEANAFGELPAAVYTRGFVIAYARTLGLDPQQVGRSFLAKFEEARSEGRRGGLLSGRR